MIRRLLLWLRDARLRHHLSRCRPCELAMREMFATNDPVPRIRDLCDGGARIYLAALGAREGRPGRRRT